jgi:hypothetical protein
LSPNASKGGLIPPNPRNNPQSGNKSSIIDTDDTSEVSGEVDMIPQHRHRMPSKGGTLLSSSSSSSRGSSRKVPCRRHTVQVK